MTNLREVTAALCKQLAERDATIAKQAVQIAELERTLVRLDEELEQYR